MFALSSIAFAQAKTRYYNTKSQYQGYSTAPETNGTIRYYDRNSKYQGYSTGPGTRRYYTPNSQYKGYDNSALKSILGGNDGQKESK
jgi:hypothetical protein